MCRSSLLVAAAAVVAAVASVPGCASHCARSCPATELVILAPAGTSLDVMEAEWTGPACPADIPRCRGVGTSCQRFGMVAGAPGGCDLTITFKDNHTATVHGEFGPAMHQGCCQGFPV